MRWKHGRVFSALDDSITSVEVSTGPTIPVGRNDFQEAVLFVSFARDYTKLVRPFVPMIKKAALWVCVVQVFALFEPYMVMRVVNLIMGTGHAANDEIGPMCLLMLGILTAIGVINMWKTVTIRDVWTTIEHDLPLIAGTKLLELPYVFHQTENTGLLVGKIVRGVYKCGQIMGVFLFDIFPLFIQTLVTGALLAYYSPPSALIFAAVFVAFVAITSAVKSKWAAYRMARHRKFSDADEVLGQAITNVMTTQAFAQELREMSRVRMIRDEIVRLMKPEFRAYDVSDFARNTLVSAGRVGVIYVCATSVLDGSLSVGMLVFVITLAEKVFIGCYRIGAIFETAMEAIDAVREINAIMAEVDTVPDPAEPVAIPPRLVGGIEFRNVDYAYRNRRDGKEYHASKLALTGINLTFPAGKMIAIVGKSGSGKSTLGKLIMRCDDPTAGQILLDGVDLRTYAKRQFRRQIGYVLQDVQIYDMTVAENIAYGRPDATREEIELAATIADAHGFIGELEDGYDTKVGDRGFRLSGGLRQRLGIARAWLLDPPIVILDEATSSVDAIAEAKIQRFMATHKGGRTFIVIAHRLSTIQSADIIVVLENGRIKETGTDDQLRRRNGLYNELVSIQNSVEATL